MNNNRKIQLDSLKNQWISERKYNIFCEDGILVESEWEKSSPKIMFLLKETYVDFPK